MAEVDIKSNQCSSHHISASSMVQRPVVQCFPRQGGSSSSAASDSQLSVFIIAELTTNVKLLMLALDVVVEAEQLVSSTGTDVVLLVVAVLPVELVCVSMDAGLTFFLTIYTFSSQRNEQQLCLATYGPLVEFPLESKG